MSEHHYSHELVDKVTERLCDHEHGTGAFHRSTTLRGIYASLAREVIEMALDSQMTPKDPCQQIAARVRIGADIDVVVPVGTPITAEYIQEHWTEVIPLDVMYATLFRDPHVEPRYVTQGYCTCYPEQQGRTADCGIPSHREAAAEPVPNDDSEHALLKPVMDKVEHALYELEDAERSGKLHKSVVSEGVWTALSSLHNLLTIVRSRL